MNDGSRKLTSLIFGSGMIILIIISFMFSGSYDSFRSTPDTVAKVGSHIITYREYDQEIKRQMGFYQQFMGGKPLTKQQIEQFRLKENALKNLINRTILVEFGESIGLDVSKDEIIKEIKEQSYFQTNKQFDINKYKGILKANQYTPEQWEENTKKDLLRQKINSLFDTLSISKELANEIKKYKNVKKTISLVQIDKAALRAKLPITDAEVNEYLAKPENKETVKKLFEQRKASLTQEEQVNAHHILLKTNGKNDAEVKKKIDKIYKELTPKNFPEKANKYTEDNNMDQRLNIKKGGSLGWFGRGKMVPEFEKTAFGLKVNGISKPVKTQFGYHIIWVKDKKEKVDPTLAKFEKDIAKEQLRNGKTKELDEFANKVAAEAEGALKKGPTQAERVANKYGLTIEKEVAINRLEGHKGRILVTSKQVKKIFDYETTGFEKFEDPAKTILISVKPYVKPKTDKVDVEEKLDLVRRRVARLLSRTLRENIIESYKEALSIYQNESLL